MTRIPVGFFARPKPGALAARQRQQLASKYPVIASVAALDGVERVLNEFFVDIERYGMMPDYAGTLGIIRDLRKALAKSTKQLRSLTTSGADNARTFVAVEVEHVLSTMKAGQHLSLEMIDDALGTVNIALEEVVAKLTTRYGGKKGKPAEVAVDMWIERMICLWQSLGAEIVTTWADDSAPAVGDTGSNGRRTDEFFKLLGELVAIANDGFMPGGDTLAVAADLSARALDQRAYRVLAAWTKAPAYRRQRRKDEIKKFCTSVLRQGPPESGTVPARDKEARADGDTGKRKRKHRSAKSGNAAGAARKRRQDIE